MHQCIIFATERETCTRKIIQFWRREQFSLSYFTASGNDKRNTKCLLQYLLQYLLLLLRFTALPFWGSSFSHYRWSILIGGVSNSPLMDRTLFLFFLSSLQAFFCGSISFLRSLISLRKINLAHYRIITLCSSFRWNFAITRVWCTWFLIFRELEGNLRRTWGELEGGPRIKLFSPQFCGAKLCLGCCIIAFSFFSLFHYSKWVSSSFKKREQVTHRLPNDCLMRGNI